MINSIKKPVKPARTKSAAQKFQAAFNHYVYFRLHQLPYLYSLTSVIKKDIFSTKTYRLLAIHIKTVAKLKKSMLADYAVYRDNRALDKNKLQLRVK